LNGFNILILMIIVIRIRICVTQGDT